MKTLLTLLKKLLTLLKKAIGIPLFVWLFLFLVWYGLINYYTLNVYEDKTVHLQILIALNLVGLTMFITLFGYLFSVAINVSKEKEKPLYPIGLKNAFKWGIKVLLRLIFINSPIIAILLLNNSDENLTGKMSLFILCYLVLIVSPYLLMLIVKSDNMPYIKGFKDFFYKNASFGFACIFWITLSFIITNNLQIGLLKLANLYSTNIYALQAYAFTIVFLIFYWLFFSAVLLGFFAKKAALNEKLLQEKETNTSKQKENPTTSETKEKTLVKKNTKKAK